jgi:transcription antitermination factor NusG
LLLAPNANSVKTLTAGEVRVVTYTGGATQFIGSTTLAYRESPAIESCWLAVQTKPRHEKRVAAELEEKGVVAFLPLSREIHQWSDRKREVEVPLFSTYVFVRIEEPNSRIKVLQTNGVFHFVGVRGAGSPIPDEQIETLQTIIRHKVFFSQHPFLNIGQKVRVRGGSLDGICGVLAAINNDRSLIVSVDTIQRSLAVRIDSGYGIEPI